MNFFIQSVRYLTLLDRFLNEAAERGQMAVHLGNVGLFLMAVPASKSPRNWTGED